MQATYSPKFMSLCGQLRENSIIPPEYYEKYGVCRGLRNADGTGVVAGITNIGNVQGYVMIDGEKTPLAGRLIYRGYDMISLINGFTSEKRTGFEEVAYLLLFGALPTAQQYADFRELLAEYAALPPNFTEDMILKAPSKNIMNKLARSVLALYSYDDDPDNTGLENMLHQSMGLIARFPTIVAHAYSVMQHYYQGGSLYIHRPDKNLLLAENFLAMSRLDKKYTEEEARLLDLCLVIHAEHGGGNNSAFACRVLSSTGTDTYSAVAAAVGSLKGPRHGGANAQVMNMFDEIKANVKNWSDEGEVRDYLAKILRKEAGDGSGLIYGMGHAVYTVSDPRALVLKRSARSLAEKTGLMEEFDLMETIERLTPDLFAEIRHDSKAMCANVDMYSGLVYKMLNIPEELYTPIFAVSRITGWCAHRIEEVLSSGKIIRPAYKAVAPMREYITMDRR